jgi:hypothetical protein
MQPSAFFIAIRAVGVVFDSIFRKTGTLLKLALVLRDRKVPQEVRRR